MNQVRLLPEALFNIYSADAKSDIIFRIEMGWQDNDYATT